MVVSLAPVSHGGLVLRPRLEEPGDMLLGPRVGARQEKAREPHCPVAGLPQVYRTAWGGHLPAFLSVWARPRWLHGGLNGLGRQKESSQQGSSLSFLLSN